MRKNIAIKRLVENTLKTSPYFFSKIIIVTALLLIGCGEKERAEKMDAEWNKAEMIDVKYYKSNTDSRYLQTFEMDGYKIVIYTTNGRGSAMVAVPLNEKENE